jgi:hypothetical protein
MAVKSEVKDSLPVVVRSNYELSTMCHEEHDRSNKKKEAGFDEDGGDAG